MGRPDSGVDPTSFYSSETLVPLKPFETWPATVKQTGWMKWFRAKRPRTKAELIDEMSAELNEVLPGVNWTFTQTIRDTVLEVLSGVQGENSVKIIGALTSTNWKPLARKSSPRCVASLASRTLGCIASRDNLESGIGDRPPEKCGSVEHQAG